MMNSEDNPQSGAADLDKLDYKVIGDLLELMPEVTADTIVSRTVFADDRLRAILFGFAAGQELSEHTAARPAVLHFLSGEADVTLGDDKFEAQPGMWTHMPANLPHSILAKTPVAMLLLLL